MTTMQTTQYIWQNGKMLPWDEAKTHVLSHTLHYGGGAFEGIRFYKTANGPAIFCLAQHVERLLYSCSVIKMELPYDAAAIAEAIIEVVRVNKLEEGYIRPLAYYGYGKMGVSPQGAPAELAIACWPWGAYLPHDMIDVLVSKYIRIHPGSSVVDAKLCGHYVNGILASIELRGTHYHEALLLDADGNIAEGVGENFFMVKDGVIYTPMLGTILAGITRATTMKLANDLGYKVVETTLKLDEAYAADEAFFTGTAAEVAPIRTINDKILGNGQLGPVTSKIKSGYFQIVHGENPAYMDYLTVVNR
ncbi:branched-chain amino acid transaminase [soil metagenome]